MTVPTFIRFKFNYYYFIYLSSLTFNILVKSQYLHLKKIESLKSKLIFL